MLHSSIATTRDKLFIITCILSGSKKGRYTLDAYVPVSMKNIKSEIHSILHSHRTLCGERTFALIYKRGGKRVAVAIIRSGPGPALHAMAVAPGNRGKGYGPMIIDSIYSWRLAGHHHDGCYESSMAVRKLFARCVHDEHHAELNDPATAGNYREVA